MNASHPLPLSLLAIMLIGLSGCQSLNVKGGKAAYPQAASPEDVLAAQQALAATKSRFVILTPPKEPLKPFTPQNGGVVVELDQQLAYVYQDGKLVAVTRVASGRRNHRTETGMFTVGAKNKEHRSNIYGNYVDAVSGKMVTADVDTRIDPPPAGAVYSGASMANFLRLHYNGKSTPIGFHRGVVPNHPASHGCIRLPANASTFFYENFPIGLPVLVRGEQYGVPYGTRQKGSGSRPPKTPKIDPALATTGTAPVVSGTATTTAPLPSASGTSATVVAPAPEPATTQGLPPQ